MLGWCYVVNPLCVWAGARHVHWGRVLSRILSPSCRLVATQPARNGDILLLIISWYLVQHLTRSLDLPSYSYSVDTVYAHIPFYRGPRTNIPTPNICGPFSVHCHGVFHWTMSSLLHINQQCSCYVQSRAPHTQSVPFSTVFMMLVSGKLCWGSYCHYNLQWRVNNKEIERGFRGLECSYLCLLDIVPHFRSGLMLIWNGTSLSMGWWRILECPLATSGNQTSSCTTGTASSTAVNGTSRNFTVPGEGPF